jgi:hypothetical protein
MWILRFHLLKSKDYNKISRICKKYGFVTRIHSPVVFAKAYIKYTTQKTSWRALSREFGIDYGQLHRFHDFVKFNHLEQQIFHVFLETRSALFIGNSRQFEVQLLDHSQEILALTQKQFASILL